jgi:hypothetical protein
VVVGPSGIVSARSRAASIPSSVTAKYDESVSSGGRRASRPPRRHGDAGGQRGLVLVGIRVEALLDGADAERRAGRRVDAGERVWDAADGGDQLGLGHGGESKPAPRRQGATAGTCWVMQCTPPPPCASVVPGTPITSRPGNSEPSVARASASAAPR